MFGRASSLRCLYGLALGAALPVLLFSSDSRAVNEPLVSGPMVLTSTTNDVSPALRTLETVNEPPASDVGATGGGSLIGPVESFEGIANQENDGGSVQTPPDPNGAAGPLNYVQWVNRSLAVYDKRGARQLGPIPGKLIWSGFGDLCEEQNRGDPVVRYDQLADRWILTQLAFPGPQSGLAAPHYQCFAVSTGPDPLGTYYRYAFDIPGGFNDYVKVAIWPDAYYMTDDRYEAGVGPLGAGAFALDRSAMLAGRPATLIYFQLGLPLAGILPSDLDGPTPAPAATPDIFVKAHDGDCNTQEGEAITPDRIELWSFSANFASPTESDFTLSKTLEVDSFDSGCGTYTVDQPGINRPLDLLGGRMLFRTSVRNFGVYRSLLALHADVDPDGRAGLRWYEIRNPAAATADVYQQGTYFGPSGDTESRWAGSLAQDGAGNIALGFSVVGPTVRPSIGYAGRRATDPLGVFTTGDGRVATGGGVQESASFGRWGDYSSLTVDPVDDCTFWYTHEYYPASAPFDWHTRIGSFRFGNCGAVPTISGSPQEGSTLTASPGAWPTLPGASFSYQWRRCNAPGSSCVDIAGATGRTYTVRTTEVDSTVRVLVRASTGRAEASALSDRTLLITPTPAAGALDLRTSIAATPTVAEVGDLVTFTVTVGNASATGSATDVVLRVQLPTGAGDVESSSDRGSPCSGALEVLCPLNFIPGGRTATVTITARLTARGRQTAVAAVTALQASTDPSAAQASVSVQVQGKPTLTVETPVRTGHSAGAVTVSAAVSLDEPATVTVRCLGPRGGMLALLKGSAVGKTVLSRAKRSVTVQAAAGNLRIALRLAPDTERGRLVIQATDSDGETATLSLPFDA